MADNGTYYQRDRGWHPPPLTPAYKTSLTRSPRLPLLSMPNTLAEMTGPVFAPSLIGPKDNDLILNWSQSGEPIGPRIIVYGRVLDEDARPVPNALIEIWQANAGGRYRHKRDGYLVAPLDPNFGGCGRTMTDVDGNYRFRTIRPGSYPWPNGVNDWRPAHIHFLIFGRAFAQRLITQMYFEGDPMIWQCPIAGGIASRQAVQRLVGALDREATIPMDAMVYKWDIVLRGRRATMFENRMEGL